MKRTKYVLALSLFLILIIILAGCQNKGKSANNKDAVTNKTSEFIDKNIIKDTVQYVDRPGFDKGLVSLDIYREKDDSKNKPVMIMIHGGGWQIGDKAKPNVVNPKSSYFISKGYVFVSINYRLSIDDRVEFPDPIEDVAAAIKWVNNNINKYGGDGNNIYIIGHSAGAHLAALAVTDLSYIQAEGIDPKIIKGAILLDSADYDIVYSYHHTRDPKRIIDLFGTDESLMKLASPTEYITPGKEIPRLLILYASGRQLLTTPEQAKMLYDKLVANGYENRATIKGIPNKKHGDMNVDVGKPNDPLTIAIDEFLGI